MTGNLPTTSSEPNAYVYDEFSTHITAQAKVAERLRRQIFTGQLLPGARVQQIEVASRMRTSTTPVREAIRELVVEGLLDLDPHRGAVVHQPTPDELKELYELRMVLEPISIAKTVEFITDAVLERASHLNDLMERETDPANWVILNRDFHALLSHAAQSPLLHATLTALRGRAAVYVARLLMLPIDRIAVGNQEHAELLGACFDRDKDRAVQIAQDHLKSTVELVESHITRP